ncbi:MAG: hypothetical protein ACI8VC_000869 [Candidatus Endobugula sp.]
MSIFSRIDSQSLYLTQKLLKIRSPKLSDALPEQSQSRYSIGEVTIELDVPTINKVIEELTAIGQEWLDDNKNECFEERKQIMSYLLIQWIHVGEETQNHIKVTRVNV